MAVIKLQGNAERENHIYYEFDSSEEPLGEGGMGKVYKGRCLNELTGYSKDVAIKFMYSDLPNHVIERARREASLRLRNDNLVEMLGFIEITDKNVMGELVTHYHVVSELLEGVMLHDLLQGKTTDHDGHSFLFAEKLYNDYLTNPFLFAVTIIKSVLSGVMAMHDAGYIHRDIDPTNIMITKDGKIKLIDFGIAKPVNTLNTYDKRLTTAGVFIGKPWYAAPELVLGDISHQNFTTDVYAIGILFYELYTKNRPFEGPKHEVLDMQLHKKLPLKLIPRRDVREVIGKATNKKQDMRYQNVAEFRVALEKLPLVSQSHFSLGKVAAVASVLALASVAGYFIKHFIQPDPIPITKDYNYAVNLLNNNKTCQDGIHLLEDLVKKKDYKSTYLLSRLYFDLQYKKSDWDNLPDSVLMLKGLSKINSNYKKSRKLLEDAISINSNDCNSLYDLGLEYLIGDRESFEGRDLDKAKQLFEKASQIAKKTHNNVILNKLQNLQKEYNLN